MESRTWDVGSSGMAFFFVVPWFRAKNLAALWRTCKGYWEKGIVKVSLKWF